MQHAMYHLQTEFGEIEVLVSPDCANSSIKSGLTSADDRQSKAEKIKTQLEELAQKIAELIHEDECTKPTD